MQIEKELARTNLDPDKRKTLEKMHKRAEQGEFSKRELSGLRKNPRRTSKAGFKGLLNRLYTAHRLASGMRNLAPDIMVDIDGPPELRTQVLN
jgi:hypothetical protein